MKWILPTSTSFAAATLLSATAVVGSGALAAEPMRLTAAQMDAVTAGNVKISTHSSASMVKTKGDKSSTRATVVIKENGKTVFKKDIEKDIKDHADRAPKKDVGTKKVKKDADKAHARIAKKQQSVADRIAKTQQSVADRIAKHEKKLAALLDRFGKH